MTITDIANLAGVSRGTVSRVLNEEPGVKQQTRDRVLAIISKTGYVPNSNARNLKRSAARTIGVLVKGIDNPFFLSILTNIEKHLKQAGYSMILEQVESKGNEMAQGIALLKERRLMGIFFLGGSFDHEPAQVLQMTAPCVYVTVSEPGPGAEDFSFVAIDDEKEAHRAVSYLLDMGHRHILVIASSRFSRSVNRLRIAGIKRAYTQRGLIIDDSLFAVASGYDLSSGYEAAGLALDKGIDFTAVLALSDTLAIGAARLLYERGYNIPDDISVMGFDGIELTRFCQPAITTLKQPAGQIARASVDLLCGLIDKSSKPMHRFYPGELRIGESCRAINAADTRQNAV